eukprot:10690114-Lingulodinium_polyedra.AAC.1
MYTPVMARAVWQAIKPRTPKVATCTVPDSILERVLPRGPPSMPLWCCLITRLVGLRSEEAQSDRARAAVAAELEGHRRRGTWDVTQVRSLRDWMEDPRYADVVVGRVFVILGCKNSEMDESEWRYRARA